MFIERVQIGYRVGTERIQKVQSGYRECKDWVLRGCRGGIERI